MAVPPPKTTQLAEWPQKGPFSFSALELKRLHPYPTGRATATAGKAQYPDLAPALPSGIGALIGASMSTANSNGGSLFNRAVLGSLTGPLTSGQIAELLVSDGGAVDVVRLNGAKVRLEGYQAERLLKADDKNPVLVLPVGRVMSFRLRQTGEPLGCGPATPTGPGLKGPAVTAQQYELTYSPVAARVIAAEERKHGSLKRGFTAWAGLPDESVQAVTVQSLVDMLKQVVFGGKVPDALETQEAPLVLKDLLRRLTEEGYGNKASMFNNLGRKHWLEAAKASRGTWYLGKVLALFVQHGVAKAYSELAKAPVKPLLRSVNE